MSISHHVGSNRITGLREHLGYVFSDTSEGAAVTAVSRVGSVVFGPSILVSGGGTASSGDVGGDKTSVGGTRISESTEESWDTSTECLLT